MRKPACNVHNPYTVICHAPAIAFSVSHSRREECTTLHSTHLQDNTPIQWRLVQWKHRRGHRRGLNRSSRNTLQLEPSD